MRKATPFTSEQLLDVFIRLESGRTNLRQEALRLHCGSMRLSGALRGEDPVRYARVARENLRRTRTRLVERVRTPQVFEPVVHAPEPPKETPQLRACLGWCGKRFMSSSPANRFCPNCLHRQAHADYERVRGKLARFKDLRKGGE